MPGRNGNILYAAELRAHRRRVWDRVVAAITDWNPLHYKGYHPSTVATLEAALPALRDRMNGCGQVPVIGAVTLGLRQDGTAAQAGVKTCGCPGCPTCDARKAAEATAITAEMLKHLEASGVLGVGRMWHAVVSFRHRLKDDQGQNLMKFSTAMARLRSGRLLRLLQGVVWRFEQDGSIHFGEGLHPHMHFLLLLPEGTDPTAWAEGFQEAAKAALEAEGLEVAWGRPDPTGRTGWWTKVRNVQACAAYMAKVGSIDRPVEDLAFLAFVLKGVRMHGAMGVFREARRATKEAHEVAKKDAPKVQGIMTISAPIWSAAGRRAREDAARAMEAMAALGASPSNIRVVVQGILERRIWLELVDCPSEHWAAYQRARAA